MVKPYPYVCGGYEAITVNDTAIGFTAAKITPTTGSYARMDCQMVELTIETDDIRYTQDGTTPTNAIGHLWDTSFHTGHKLRIYGSANIKAFRMIKVNNAASVKCSYFF